MMNVINFISGVIASIIGVLISIWYEKKKETKRIQKEQSEQWMNMISEDSPIYNIQVWSNDFFEYLKDADNNSESDLFDGYISANALYCQLACNQVPEKYKSTIFQMANVIENIYWIFNRSKSLDNETRKEIMDDLEIVKGFSYALINKEDISKYAKYYYKSHKNDKEKIKF